MPVPDASALLVPAVVALTALAASVLAAVAGFGGAVVLLPVLVWAFGVREAVPILTVVQMVGNGARVALNRRELVWPVVGWFSLGAVPSAALGGMLFVTAPTPFLQRLLGLFLLAAVVYRHTAAGRRARLPLRGFAGLGAAAGFGSALLGTVGPVVAPFFLSYGLVKGAYIGTEAAATVVMHTTKLVAYGGAGVLGSGAALTGLALAPAMFAGSWVGKRVLARVTERAFATIIDAVLLVSGALLIAGV